VYERVSRDRSIDATRSRRLSPRNVKVQSIYVTIVLFGKREWARISRVNAKPSRCRTVGGTEANRPIARAPVAVRSACMAALRTWPRFDGSLSSADKNHSERRARARARARSRALARVRWIIDRLRSSIAFRSWITLLASTRDSTCCTDANRVNKTRRTRWDRRLARSSVAFQLRIASSRNVQ